MKTIITSHQLYKILTGEICNTNVEPHIVDSILYDTRMIPSSGYHVFFALCGQNSNGHSFIADAYSKGIRTFVVQRKMPIEEYPGAVFIQVDNTQNALVKLATYYRSFFTGKVIMISGHLGKTKTKEWLYYFLNPEHTISRSPGSYNSLLGAAVSILSADTHSEFVLIEAKPHEETDPSTMNTMIKPDFVIHTSDEKNFLSNNYFGLLYSGAQTIFKYSDLITSKNNDIAPDYKSRSCSFSESKNIDLAMYVASYLGVNMQVLCKKNQTKPAEVFKREVYDGEHNNSIFCDYNIGDDTSILNALKHQQSISNKKQQTILIMLREDTIIDEIAITQYIQQYQIDYLKVVKEGDISDLDFYNRNILITGNHKEMIDRTVNQLKLKRHKTQLRINLRSLRRNISFYKKMLPENTKLMLMLKASGYGSGLDKIVQYIDRFGIDYYAVAYVDEGISIRKIGITSPIMVMNTEQENYEACIKYKLEPAIFDFQQLQEFVWECNRQNVKNYPIHLKIDTGMNRLGFKPEQIGQVLHLINTQNEIKIQTVYSHLAESDNLSDTEFTNVQLEIFRHIILHIQQAIDYAFDSHIQNSSGISNHSFHTSTMARLGIGMYGITNNPTTKESLDPVLSWISYISQVKMVKKGKTIGYDRSYVCKRDTMVATIPVGYADGLRRSLSNGKGFLNIQGIRCPIIGKICMDMTMVDVTDANAHVGSEVEIFGQHCTIEMFADLLDTIPYEVMTSISERVQKIYIE